MVTKWLSLGALGVLSLIAGVVLGFDATSGQILGVVGIVLILISVVAFPLAARWALFRAKGRAVVFGAGIMGRIVGAILLVAVVAFVLFMAT